MDRESFTETFEVDTDGNKLIVYSGGVVVKNYYPDERKNPLLMDLYVPVEKALIEIKQARGIECWEYEPIDFVIYNRDPVKIKN